MEERSRTEELKVLEYTEGPAKSPPWCRGG